MFIILSTWSNQFLSSNDMAMRAYALREESDFKMDLITELKGQKTEKR